MDGPSPTPRRSRQAEWNAAWLGVAKALGTFAAFVLSLGVLFFLYFVLPKIEVLYHDRGRRMPTPLFWASIFSHYLFKYFWLVLISCGLLLVLWMRGDSPRAADRARD